MARPSCQAFAAAWGPSDAEEPCCTLLNSTNANLVTRITQYPNEVDRAFDTAYNALRLWEEREKYNAYHFFFLQDYSSTRSFVERLFRESVGNDPQTGHAHNSLAFAQKIVGPVR